MHGRTWALKKMVNLPMANTVVLRPVGGGWKTDRNLFGAGARLSGPDPEGEGDFVKGRQKGKSRGQVEHDTTNRGNYMSAQLQ
jgi:hypothetical protein